MAELQTQKEFVKNLSEKGKNRIQKMPSKKREYLDKIRILGEHWKTANKVAHEQKEKILNCVNELETFNKKYASCMVNLEEMANIVCQSGEVQELSSTFEDIITLGNNISAWVPEKDRHIIEERLQRLRVAWENVQALGEQTSQVHTHQAKAAEKIKEALIERKAFMADITNVSSWLEEAEATLNIDMFSVPEEKQMDEILRQENLCQELEQQRLQVGNILERKISTVGLTTSQKDDMTKKLQTLSTKWNRVQRLADEHGNHLEQCISQQANYYEELEKCVLWMQQTGEVVAADSLSGKDLSAVKEELLKHKQLCKEIVKHEADITSVITKGKELVSKLSQDEKQAVHDQVTRIDEEWRNLKSQARNKEKEITEFLGLVVEEQDYESSKFIPEENVTPFMASHNSQEQLKTTPFSTHDEFEEKHPAVRKISDNQKYFDDLTACIELVKNLECKCIEQESNGLEEVESNVKLIESVIKRGEMHDELANEEQQFGFELLLEELKQKWEPLKTKARACRSREGQQGSNLESKQLTFDAEITQFRHWLDNIKSQVPGDVYSTEMKVMEKAMKECIGLKEEVSSFKPQIDDLLHKGEELVLEWQNEDKEMKEKDEAQTTEVRNEWQNMEKILEIKLARLQDYVEKLNTFNTSLETFENSVHNVEMQIQNLNSEENHESSEADLGDLKPLLSQMELLETSLSSILNQGYSIAAMIEGSDRAKLESKLGDINMNLPHLKQSVASEVERLEEVVTGKKVLEENLQVCKEIIEKAAIISVKNALPFEEQLKKVTNLDLVMAASENPLALVVQKSIETFPKLKPFEREALAVEIKAVETKWEEAQEETRGRADTLQKKMETLTECESDLSECGQQLGRIQEEVLNISVDTLNFSSLDESKIKVEQFLVELEEQDSSLAIIREKGGAELINSTENEDPILTIRIASLETKTQDIRDVATLKLAEIHQILSGHIQYEKLSSDFSSWLDTQKEVVNQIVEDTFEALPVKQLEKLKVIQSELVVREKDIDKIFEVAEQLTENLNSCEKEVIDSQKEKFEHDFAEVTSITERHMQLFFDQATALRVFEDEVKNCNDVIKRLQGSLTEDPSQFSKCSDIENRIQEKKQEVEAFEANSEHFLRLKEKKNNLSSISNKTAKSEAERKFDEVMKNWDSLQKHHNQSLSELERCYVEEQEIEQSIEDALNWLDNSEKELSLTLESVSETIEMEDRAEVLTNICSECSSYKEFVQLLEEKVQQSPCYLEPTYRESREQELSSLKSKLTCVQRLAYLQLEELEDCVAAIKGVSLLLLSCKKWLLDQRDLLKEQMPGLEDKHLLEKKLSVLKDCEVKIGFKMADINEANKKVSEKLAKVSPVLKRSLETELDNVNDSLDGLLISITSKIVTIENLCAQRSDFEKQIEDYDFWCEKKEMELKSILSSSSFNIGLQEKLKKLQCLEKEKSEKREEYFKFRGNIQGSKLEEVFEDKLNCIAQAFRNLAIVQDKVKDLKDKILEASEKKQQLEQTLRWVTDAWDFVNSEADWLIDETLAIERLTKLENLCTEMENLTPRVQSILADKSILDLASDAENSNLKEQFSVLGRSWRELNECIGQKQLKVKTFVNDKHVYDERLLQCDKVLDSFEDLSQAEISFSSNLNKVYADINRHADIICEIETQQTLLKDLTEACDILVLHSAKVRPTVMETLKKVLDKWKEVSYNLSDRKKQMELYAIELAEFQETLTSFSDFIDQVKKDADNEVSLSFNMTEAKSSLENLQKSKANLDSCESDFQALKQKCENILAKVEEGSKAGIKSSLNKSQQHLEDTISEINSKIETVEKYVDEIAVFEQEMAHFGSLITIYEAALPKETIYSEETISEKARQLTRIYQDMESRDARVEMLKKNSFSIVEPTECNDESPKVLAAQLCQNWDDLKYRISKRLKDQQEIVQIRKELEQELQEGFTEINALEPVVTGLSETKAVNIEENIQSAKELCSKIELYQAKLETLSEKGKTLPETALGDESCNPTVRLISLQKQLDELKLVAFTKLQVFEAERNELETLSYEVAKIKEWLGNHSVAATATLEDEISEVQRASHLINENVVNTKHLLDKANEVSDGPNKNRLLEQLSSLSDCLQCEQERLRVREKSLHTEMSQRNAISDSLKTCKQKLSDIETFLANQEISEPDTEFISQISTAKSHLESIPVVGEILSNASRNLETLKNQSDDVYDDLKTNIHLLTKEHLDIYKRLTSEVSELEIFEKLLQDCENTRNNYQGHLLDIREPSMQAVIEEDDLSVTEDELTICRNLQPVLEEEEKDYNRLWEQYTSFCNLSRPNRKELTEKRIQEISALRNELSDLFCERFDALKKLIAEQQTLEGWLQASDVALQEGMKFLDKEGFPSEVNLQEVQLVITKLSEYKTYSKMFRNTSRSAEVMLKCNEITETIEKLEIFEEQLKREKEQKDWYNRFDELTRYIEFLSENCAGSEKIPLTVTEALAETENIKVRI